MKNENCRKSRKIETPGCKKKRINGLGFLPAHHALQHVITGYYFIDNPSFFQDKTAMILSSSMMILHMFQDDTWVKISHGKQVAESIYSGITGGQLTTPLNVAFKESIRTVSIEMYPIAYQLIFGFSAAELFENVIPSNDLPEKELDSLIDRIRHESQNINKKHMLDQYFLKKMKSYRVPLLFDQVYSRFSLWPGAYTVGELQRTSGMSKRQFERKFKEQAGASASMIRRTLRCNAAVSQILLGKNVQDIVFDLNYVDQSHLIKDIKWCTGKTPQAIYQTEKNRAFKLGRTTFLLP